MINASTPPAVASTPGLSTSHSASPRALAGKRSQNPTPTRTIPAMIRPQLFPADDANPHALREGSPLGQSRLPDSNDFFSSVMFMPSPLSSLHSTSNATGMPASSLFEPLTIDS